MRARLAIRSAGVTVELREVVLRHKPQELLLASPKGTVPVLVLADGTVIDESRDIMSWALAEQDLAHWLPQQDEPWQEAAQALIDTNDFSFKPFLDKYKYADRHPEYPAEAYRAQGCGFLKLLDQRLQQHRYLMTNRITHVDKQWFDTVAFSHLQHWLAELIQSALFTSVMEKYPPWQGGDQSLLFP